MRAQTLSDTAGSKSALAPLPKANARPAVQDPGNPEQSESPVMLDGVGITPDPDPSLAGSLPAQKTQTDEGVQRLFVRAYSLVAAALLISAAVASQVRTEDPDDFVSHQATIQLAFFFEIACVAFLSRYVPKLPRDLAALLLFVCAAVNGASFTAFLIWIPATAIAYGFLLCAFAFAATATIASWRNIDLSAPRGILLLFGVGITLITVITAPLRIDADYWGTSFTGFVIFAALASYYCDDIRELDLEFEDDLPGWKSAICGALILYLNFINIYLLTMRLFFSSSDDRRRRLRQ